MICMAKIRGTDMDINEVDDSQNIGELLRNTRLKQGKTISDISKDLCIRKVYIDAIENMDVKNLPELPYCLGFVKSYAQYLGLNSTRITQSYKVAVYKETDGNHNKNVPSEENEKNSIPHLAHIIGAMLGLVVVISIWQIYSSSTDKTDNNLITETSEYVAVPEPMIVNETEAETEAETELESIGLQELTQVNVEVPVDNIITETTVEENKEVLTSSENNTQAAENQNNLNNITKIEVILTGPSWLEIRKGKDVLISGIYSKGFRYEIPSEEGIVISVGRHYNVEFYIDGQLTKIASSLKQTNISLDKYIKKAQ